MYIKYIHTSLSTRSCVFQVNSSHPHLSSAHNPVSVRLIFWSLIVGCFSIHFQLGSTNGFAARFLGFSVYVSNTTNKSEGSLCFKDTNYTVNTIPPVINISCPMHGQYVIYYNERLSWTSFPSDAYQYAFNELCEFEVYGMHSII